MEIFLILLAVVAAAGAGFYIGQNLSASAKKRNILETKLKETQDELDTFKSKVNNHFEKTANLFNNVSDSYQKLYDHMAKSSTLLCSEECATETFQALPKSPSESLNSPTQENTSSTLNDSSKTTQEQDLFDAEHLYNAHNYRNQNLEDSDSINQPTETTNSKPDISETKATESTSHPKTEPNVVDIGSAKTVSKEPARDYATKD